MVASRLPASGGLLPYSLDPTNWVDDWHHLLEQLGYNERLRSVPSITGMTLGRCRGHILGRRFVHPSHSV
eukprot:3515008-Amphidinium_carterae.1